MLMAGLGGFIGTCCRFLTNKFCAVYFPGIFPTATFIVNVLGCFLFGLTFGFLQQQNLLTSRLYYLMAIGFCGGYTTFSTFSNEIYSLSIKGEMAVSVFYLVASVVAGLIAVWAGRWITTGATM